LSLGNEEAAVPKYPQGAVAQAGAFLTRASILRLQREREALAEEVEDWKKVRAKDRMEINRLKEEVAKLQAELARMDRDKVETRSIQEEIKKFEALREEATRREPPTTMQRVDLSEYIDTSDAEDQCMHDVGETEAKCSQCQSLTEQLAEAREARHIVQRQNRRLEIQVEELLAQLKEQKEESGVSTKSSQEQTIRRLKAEMAQHKQHFDETIRAMRQKVCEATLG